MKYFILLCVFVCTSVSAQSNDRDFVRLSGMDLFDVSQHRMVIDNRTNKVVSSEACDFMARVYSEALVQSSLGVPSNKALSNNSGMMWYINRESDRFIKGVYATAGRFAILKAYSHHARMRDQHSNIPMQQLAYYNQCVAKVHR